MAVVEMNGVDDGYVRKTSDVRGRVPLTLDAKAYRFVFLGAGRVMEGDAPATTFDGDPKWDVLVAMASVDGGGADTVRLGMVGHVDPADGIDLGAVVEFGRVSLSMWEVGGRAGLSYSAEGLRVAGQRATKAAPKAEG